MGVIPFYCVMYLVHSFTQFVTSDDVLSTYTLSILVNSTYLVSIAASKFNPSQYVADAMMQLLLAYYAFDTQKLINGKEPLSEKVAFIPHHLVSIALIMGQVLNFYPLALGTCFLTFFEISNFFLQFFQLANKKKWHNLRRFFSYPFVLTYIPFRGIIIPIYSLNFVPHLVKLQRDLALLYLCLFAFIDMFSVYFACVVFQKFILHLKTKK